jgi:uncharacterized membrane protein
MGALSQFFLNPAIAAAGGLLVLSPIIIHLINRVRYRKVRFAAMEFLLEAEQRNRRRLLMEQLLLLLLRILIVLGLAALIARLVLDARLTVFSGDGRTHHLVLLDDSGSMRNRVADKIAFDEAKAVIRHLVEEGAQRPGTQTFSMLLMSQPERPFFSERDVDEGLVNELETKLDSLEPTYGRPNLEDALETAGQALKLDQAVIKHLHVLSDYRRGDWTQDESVGKVIEELSESGVTVNLIRAVGEETPNLGVTRLDADLQTAAVGVPVRFTVAVRNYGRQVAEDVRLTLSVDGQKLPLSVAFDKLEPGEEITQVKDITFPTAGLHQVKTSLPSDALPVDNERFLALDVPLRNNVLIVGNQVDGLPEQILMYALASDPDLSGISPRIETGAFLQTEPLGRFRAVYMLNQSELTPVAVENLESYVRDGGGLVWFAGELVRPDVYNALLAKAGTDDDGNFRRLDEGLFPVPLADARATLDHGDPTATAPDLLFDAHPIADRIAGGDSPLLTGVRVDEFFPLAEGWQEDDEERGDGVKTIGYLKGRQPVVFDHQFGRGRVITFLTTAGPPWTNLQETLAFVPLIQQIQKYVAKPDVVQRQRIVGEPIRLDVSAVDYDDTVIFVPPGGGVGAAIEYRMERRTEKPKDDAKDDANDGQPAAAGGEPSKNTDRLHALFDDTAVPGVYSYELQPRLETLPREGAFAYNIAPQEGDTVIADEQRLRQAVGKAENVFIRDYGDTDYISQGVDPGREVRNFLIYALLALLAAEQALAYKLSYHPESAPQAA